MKLFYLFLLISMCSISNAFAYLDKTPTRDEAKTSSGDQKTNFHSLTAIASSNIRRLKKLDEAYTRNPNQTISDEDLENIEIRMDATSDESKNILALRKSLKEVESGLKKANTMIVKLDSEKYIQLSEVFEKNKLDSAIIDELSSKLRRIK